MQGEKKKKSNLEGLERKQTNISRRDERRDERILQLPTDVGCVSPIPCTSSQNLRARALPSNTKTQQ